MKPKKDIVITFRTDAETKAKLDKMAEEKEWSVSQVVEKICKEYLGLQRLRQYTSGNAERRFLQLIIWWYWRVFLRFLLKKY